jgi:hypothetical protein
MLAELKEAVCAEPRKRNDQPLPNQHSSNPWYRKWGQVNAILAEAGNGG